MSPEYYIQKLELLPHPEGGFYKEIYRSPEKCDQFPSRYRGSRNLSTSIYYLLEGHQFSVFHRLKSDEIWHFYDGTRLNIYILNQDKKLVIQSLGRNLKNNERLQVVVPRDHWFAAQPDDKDSYTLVGCTVAPGFDFLDFEIANREELLREYGEYWDTILKYTKKGPSADGPSS